MLARICQLQSTINKTRLPSQNYTMFCLNSKPCSNLNGSRCNSKELLAFSNRVELKNRAMMKNQRAYRSIKLLDPSTISMTLKQVRLRSQPIQFLRALTFILSLGTDSSQKWADVRTMTWLATHMLPVVKCAASSTQSLEPEPYVAKKETFYVVSR